jgi:hypothetical protein
VSTFALEAMLLRLLIFFYFTLLPKERPGSVMSMYVPLAAIRCLLLLMSWRLIRLLILIGCD